LAAVALAWLALVGGASPTGGCDAASEMAPLRAGPHALRPLFDLAAQHYGLGALGPSILAALTDVESGFGRNMGPSSQGAVGWTQFLPATWQRYGIDADGDGRRNPY